MKLLVVSHPCATEINQQIYAELAQVTGWEITLVVPDGWRDEFGNGLDTQPWPGACRAFRRIPVWRNGSIILHVYRARLGGWLRAERFDAIYMNHEPYALATAQFCLANRGKSRAVFGFYSAQNIPKKYPPPFCWLERWVYRRSQFGFPITEAVSEVLEVKGFRGEMMVCPLPLDVALYRPRGRREDEALVIRSAGQFVLGYVGRLVESKGLRTLAMALSELGDIPWKLVVIGKGEFEPAFRELLAAHGIAERVEFLGYVPHAETPRYLSAFDLTLVPSETQPAWKEQFGRVITESLACGTPVIGSDSGEIPRLIRDSGGGLVFAERQSADLGEAIRRLLLDPEGYRRCAEIGRAWVLENVSLRAVAAKMAETIEQVVVRQSMAKFG